MLTSTESLWSIKVIAWGFVSSCPRLCKCQFCAFRFAESKTWVTKLNVNFHHKIDDMSESMGNSHSHTIPVILKHLYWYEPIFVNERSKNAFKLLHSSKLTDMNAYTLVFDYEIFSHINTIMKISLREEGLIILQAC